MSEILASSFMNESLPNETRELVERCRAGDERALEDLFSRHRDRLRHMIRLRSTPGLRRRIDDSDVLQEVYLEASRRVDEHLGDPRVPFFVWLRGIARQKLIDLYRHHLGAQVRDLRREVALPGATSAVLAAQLVGDLDSPSEELQKAEVESRIREALEAMAPQDREVLVLRHFEQLSNGEVAEELRLSVSAASKRYLRAVMRLRDVVDLSELEP